MCVIIVRCPDCGSVEMGKYGFSKTGEQRYKCQNNECKTKIFQLRYKDKGCKRGIEEKIIKEACNASGIRDTARVLEISTWKVMDVLKKRSHS